MAVNSYLGVQQTPFAAALANMGSQLGEGMTKAYNQNQQHKINIYNGLEAQLKQTLGDSPWAVLNESKNGEYTARALSAQGLLRQVEFAQDDATGNLRSEADILKSIQGRMAGVATPTEIRNEAFRQRSAQGFGNTEQNSSQSNTAHSEVGVKPAGKVTQGGASGVIQPKPVPAPSMALSPEGFALSFRQSKNPNAKAETYLQNPLTEEVVLKIPAFANYDQSAALYRDLMSKDPHFASSVEMALKKNLLGSQNTPFTGSAPEQIRQSAVLGGAYNFGKSAKNILGDAWKASADPSFIATTLDVVPKMPISLERDLQAERQAQVQWEAKKTRRYSEILKQGLPPDLALKQLNSEMPGDTPPRFAEGGVVTPTPGGTQMDVGGQQAVVGEGKNSEAVLPLSDDVLGKLGAAIAQYVIQAMQNPNDKPTQGDTQDVPTNAQGMPMAEGGAVITPPTPFRKFLIDKGYKINPTGPTSDEDLMNNNYPKEADNFRTLQQPQVEQFPQQYPNSQGPDALRVEQAKQQQQQSEVGSAPPVPSPGNSVPQQAPGKTDQWQESRIYQGDKPAPLPVGGDVFAPLQISKPGESVTPQTTTPVIPTKGIAKLAEMANTAKQNLSQKLYVEYPSKGEPTPTNKQIFTDPKYAQLRGDMLKAVNKENQALSAITKDPSFMRADNKRMSKLFDEIAAMTPEQAAAAGFSDLAQVGVSKRNNETQWLIAKLQEGYKAIGIARLADSLQYQLLNSALDPILRGSFNNGVFNEVSFTKALSKTPGLEDLWNQQVKLAGGNVKDAIALVTSPTWFGLGSKTELKRTGIQAPTLPGAAPQVDATTQALRDEMIKMALGNNGR